MDPQACLEQIIRRLALAQEARLNAKNQLLDREAQLREYLFQAEVATEGLRDLATWLEGHGYTPDVRKAYGSVFHPGRTAP